MNKPECPGHPSTERYEVHVDDYRNEEFDTAKEAEYPWDLCVVFAEAAFDEIVQSYPDYNEYGRGVKPLGAASPSCLSHEHGHPPH